LSHGPALATLYVEKGVVTREELERLAGGAFPLSLVSGEGRLNVVPR
jgi:nitrile hydratase subunit beta